MSNYHPSSHQNQFLLDGDKRIFMDDLSDNAKAQMINIQATDDQILHLRHRLDLLHQMRDEVARELYHLLKIDGLLD